MRVEGWGLGDSWGREVLLPGGVGVVWRCVALKRWRAGAAEDACVCACSAAQRRAAAHAPPAPPLPAAPTALRGGAGAVELAQLLPGQWAAFLR